MGGSLAQYAFPVGAWGPVRVLSLVIFLRDTAEEWEAGRGGLKKEKKKSRWPDGWKCLPQGFYGRDQLH